MRKVIVLALILFTSCTDIDFNKSMQGKWVNINDSNITLEVKENGKKMAYRYNVLNYLVDTTIKKDGEIIIDTFGILTKVHGLMLHTMKNAALSLGPTVHASHTWKMPMAYRMIRRTSTCSL